MRRLLSTLVVLLIVGLTASCAGTVGSPQPSDEFVTILPAAPQVRSGDSQALSASYRHDTGKKAGVTWTVNGIAGGNGSVGTIAATGPLTATYVGPLVLPTPNSVTITAADSTDSSRTGDTVATLLNPVPVVTNISPGAINVGSYTIVVNGSDFVTGAVVSIDGTQVVTTFISSTQLSATGTAAAAQVGTTVPIAVTNPNPGSASSLNVSAQVVGVRVTPQVADRFLEQSTFGPNADFITTVQQAGLQGFLTSQFATPISVYVTPASTESDLSLVQQRFFTDAIYAPDQVRQRVAFALSEIFVIAGDKISAPQAFTPYLQLLGNDAFTNYRQIMQDVTLSPAMGHYLDMVNNDKPNATLGTHANENYARELMQLFTLGTSLVNDDGSQQLDASSNPIPTYTQDDVEAFARAYTGWTYPTQAGATAQKHNPTYWIGPMVAYESNHDEDPKQLLQYSGVAGGGLLPSGQTAENDLTGALDNIFNHPNAPAFVSRQLIQHLVTSNPSPAYIERVAKVFKNNGSNVRGDMQAVIAAILLDPEARQGDDPTNVSASSGHLQEPILYIAGLLRAFNAVTDGSNLSYQGGLMGQTALFPGSVFNFFSPNYVVANSSLFGPEFQILTTAAAPNRANFVNAFVFGSLGSGTTVDFSAFATQATTPTALLASLNTLMLHGTMNSNMQTAVLAAMQSVPAGQNQALQQAETAIYLIATSSLYQVEH
jgi:uncharacterized protein (DUF1800 family)